MLILSADATMCAAAACASKPSARGVRQVFSRIRFILRSPVASSSARRVERAAPCRRKKYCSASIMLSKTAEMIHEVELVEAD